MIKTMAIHFTGFAFYMFRSLKAGWPPSPIHENLGLDETRECSDLVEDFLSLIFPRYGKHC